MGQIFNYQEDIESKSIWESTMVKANSSVVFSEITGPGIIMKLWLTTFPSNDKENIELAENVTLNIYWENSKTAAVSVPLSDFFCQSLRLQALENCFFHSTNNQILFASIIPMPFRKKAKLEVRNDLDKDFELFFGLDIEFKELEQNTMYLHTYWQKLNYLSPDEQFLLLPELKGRGRLLGTHLSLIQRNPLENWPWYTRPITVHLDSKSEPGLYVKTLDDFFGSAWWDREPEHNTYTYQYIGRPLVEMDMEDNLKVALYKYNVQDPLWFHESIKIEIGENWNWGKQKIGSGDWTTTSFLYLKNHQNS
ncbi:MAG: DUF2961 domain-containing protein [Bacteroidota bacterium]